MEFKFRNVNDAFNSIAEKLENHSIITGIETSRNGEVRVFPGVTTITYTNPRERVLFNLARDANPFFHLYESLWMLAGKDDVASLDYYNSNMKNYSDNGETFNGAYGFRWRNADTSVEPRDQIEILIEHLRDNPNSRRAVLQMWNVEDDLMNINDSNDVCCNLSVVFKVKSELNALDMVVFNRSNDLVWGALGANAVHFSILQEYVASALNCNVGRYSQVSSNMHMYTDTWKGEEYVKKENQFNWPNFIYTGSSITPLIEDKDRFDKELLELLHSNDTICKEPFLSSVASPMFLSWRHHKERDYVKSQEALNLVESRDWQLAGKIWITNREDKYNNRKSVVI